MIVFYSCVRSVCTLCFLYPFDHSDNADVIYSFWLNDDERHTVYEYIVPRLKTLCLTRITGTGSALHVSAHLKTTATATSHHTFQLRHILPVSRISGTRLSPNLCVCLDPGRAKASAEASGEHDACQNGIGVWTDGRVMSSWVLLLPAKFRKGAADAHA